MRDRRVDADHQFAQREHRGGVAEVGKLGAEVDDARLARKPLGIGGAQITLDADKAHVFGLKQRRKLRQRQRAVAVIDVARTARPGKRYARQRAVEPRPPFLDARGIGAEVGNLRRHAGELGLAGERQAGQRAMQIERRQRLAVADHGRDTVEAREQVFQLGLHLHHHRGA